MIATHSSLSLPNFFCVCGVCVSGCIKLSYINIAMEEVNAYCSNEEGTCTIT
jgi:hypothetical protein